MEKPDTSAWRAFCASPNENNFRPVYERTSALVYTICLRVLRDADDARDAFQSTYARMLTLAESRSDIEGFEDPDALVRRLAIREADNLRHRRGRRQKMEVAVESFPILADPGLVPDEAAASREVRSRLDALISALPDAYRVPIVLHYFHGMTQREIAEATDAPISTISTRIARGIRKLKPLAQKAGLGEVGAILGGLFGAAELLAPPASLSAAMVYGAAQTALTGSAAVAGAGALLKTSLGAAILSTKGGIFASGITVGALFFIAVAWTQIVRGPEGKSDSPQPAVVARSRASQQEAASLLAASDDANSASRKARVIAQAEAGKSAAPVSNESAGAAKTEASSGDAAAGDTSNPPKIGVLFSARTAHGPAPSYVDAIGGSMGYYFSQFTVTALQGLGFNVYVLLEPGMAEDSDLVAVLRECAIPPERILDGSSLEDLKTLDAIAAPFLHNIDEKVLQAVHQAVKDGVGFGSAGGFGYNKPGNSDILEDLMGLRQSQENYRFFQQKLACQIVAPEEMRIGVLASTSDYQFENVYGFTGPVDGTPIVMLPPEADDSFSVAYFRQCGKGRVTAIQGLYMMSGAQALTIIRMVQYFTNWTAHRRMDISWKPLNLGALLAGRGGAASASEASTAEAPAPKAPLKVGLILSRLDEERTGYALKRFNPAIYTTALKFLATGSPALGYDFHIVLDKNSGDDKEARLIVDVGDVKEDHILDGTNPDAIKGLSVIVSIYNPSLSEELLDSLMAATRSGVGFISIGKIAGVTPEAGAALENIIGLNPDPKNFRSAQGEIPVKLVEGVPQAAGLFLKAERYSAYHLSGYAGDPAASDSTPVLSAVSGDTQGVCPAYIRRLGYGRVLVCQFFDFDTTPEATGTFVSGVGASAFSVSLLSAIDWAAARP